MLPGQIDWRSRDDFGCDTARLDALDVARRLVVTWAIEKALGIFQCRGCHKSLWLGDAGGKEWVASVRMHPVVAIKETRSMRSA